MLKHMLNGSASAVGGDRSGAIRQSSSSSLNSSRGLLATVVQQQQQQQQQQQLPQPQQPHSPSHQQPPPLPLPIQQQLMSESSGELQNRLRCAAAAVEPEYQNTRPRSSPASEFHRGVQLGKSVRSLENVMVMCEPELQQQQQQQKPRLPLDPHHWIGSSTRGGRVGGVETLHQPRLHSRGSVLNHSYTGAVSALHPYGAGQGQQQHQHLPSHRLNHSDVVLSLSPTTSATSPNFTPIANGPTKLMANGGLHIPKRSPVTLATPTIVASPAVKTDSSTDISKDNNNDGDGNLRGSSHDNNNDHGRRIAGVSGPATNAGCGIVGGGGGGGGSGSNDMFSNGVKEILTSLGLLCLISLLLALLSLIFLLKITPVTAIDMKDLLRAEQFTIISPDEYVTVYEVTLALCALSLSLNLCCLLVCSVQFLFAVKLTRSSINGDRTNKYLQKSAVTRVCAIAGFFISIPVFLTGVILYTFIQFHSTPAIITSVLIGSGIVFCGCAMVHNVFVWQKEKTNAVKALVRKQRLHQQMEASKHSTSGKMEAGAGTRETSGTVLSTMSTASPHVAADLSSVTSTPHELSTLV